MRRLVIAFIASTSVIVAMPGCSGLRSMTAPSPPAAAVFGSIQPDGSDPTAVDLAACLVAAPSQSCFSPASFAALGSAGNAAGSSAPVNLVASSSGSFVTLTWAPPAGPDPPTSYILEAGSAPGLANQARFSIGGGVTTFHASGVGSGTYFIRLRAVIGNTIGPASNEAVLTVAGGSCVAPGAPVGLTLTFNSRGVVRFAWTPAAGAPSSYIVEAGSQPGLVDLANADLSSVTPAFTATGVTDGMYYVRVRAKNACGVGVPSNEVPIVVGASVPPPTDAPPAPPPPAPTPEYCAYAVSPTAIHAPFLGGQFSTALTRTAGNCSWQATTNVGWIAAVSNASGNGSGTLMFNVAANVNVIGLGRTATITIAWAGGSAQVMVSQSPFEPDICLYTLAAAGQDQVAMPSAGGDFTVTVTWINTGGPPCFWQAFAQDFVSVVGPGAGVSSGSVTFRVAPNQGPARAANVGISFVGRISQIGVSQAGAP
jgi:hypothetical protein